MCAVWEVSGGSKHLMVPGTYQCPTGWTQEYSGWLMSASLARQPLPSALRPSRTQRVGAGVQDYMSAHTGYKGHTMFVCLDKDPHAIPEH